MRSFTTAMTWPIQVLNGSANAVVRALGVEPQEELRSARSSDELASLAGRSASEGTLDTETAHLVQRSVAFGPRTAGEIMTPRVQMACVDATDPVSEVIELSGVDRLLEVPGDQGHLRQRRGLRARQAGGGGAPLRARLTRRSAR